MDEQSPAELMPGLYRDVLDAVAMLEAAGHRPEADRVRAAATHAYAHAWNQTATRRLRRLCDDARRLSGTRHRARPTRPWQVLRRRLVEGRPV